jgi:hypothetical protein
LDFGADGKLIHPPASARPHVGLHEDLDITNNGMKPLRFQLEIVIRSDFADIFEVKSGQIVRRVQITTEWSQSQQRLRTAYSHRDFRRAVTISVSRASSNAVYANGRLSFQVALEPAQSWHACLHYALEDGEEQFEAPEECIWQASKSQHAGTMAEWLQAVAKIETSNEEFYRLFRQALEDMAGLPTSSQSRDVTPAARGPDRMGTATRPKRRRGRLASPRPRRRSGEVWASVG